MKNKGFTALAYFRSATRQAAIVALTAACCTAISSAGNASIAIADETASSTIERGTDQLVDTPAVDLATTIPAGDASPTADEGGSETKPASPAEDVYALVPSESSPHLTWTKNGEPCAASGWKSFEGAWYWFDGSPTPPRPAG